MIIAIAGCYSGNALRLRMAQLLSNDSSAVNVTSAAAQGSLLASTPWWALALLGGVAALLAIALVFTLIDSYCRYFTPTEI